MIGAWIVAAFVFVATAAITALVTRMVLAALQRRAILDHPNERSSHARPTPRGGGIAVLAVLIPSWILLGAMDARIDATSLWLMIGGMVALAVLSWLDDLRSLSAGLRIVVHVIVVAIVLVWMPADDRVFQGFLPLWLDRIAAGILWIWFINLFNFMDGIDGIAGVETIAIGGGLFLIGIIGSGTALPFAGLLGLAVAGTAFGFLLWNWHPARLFLGDVGSVPLGFALGWLLLQTAIMGHWAPALILPLYYLADATITLVRRAARGAKIWQAHREHFYQQAAAQGRDHAAISRSIAFANVALIALAVTVERNLIPTLVALIAAVAVVGILLLYLSGALRRAGS
jgi:UDP-N-acetylmuramyl pentapeptide phosphotransferase/UDP-N-acetylglucosamine-1-phosphate transferase